MTRPCPARATALLAAVAVLLAACGTTAPSASVAPSADPTTSAPSSAAPPSSAASSASASAGGDTDALFDTIQQQVLAIRELEPATEVERQTIDGDELIERATTDFDADNPEAYVLANERLYKALGLMDEGASLRELYLDLIGSQVAGFYDPDSKELFVVSRSGSVNGADKITFAHEYDHALQDANFDIFQDQERLRDQTDEALARAAIYEGDATLLMSLWALPNLTQQELQEVVAAGSDPEATEILARTPRILTEGLLFPYNAGIQFVQPIQTSGGWAAVDAIYEALPTTTEQILHPEKYQAGEAAVAVDIPDDLAQRMGDGWAVELEDTWGEFQTRIWLEELGVAAADASTAAAGWGGDRLAVLSGPDDAWAVVVDTTWDDVGEADAFAAAAAGPVEALEAPGQVVADGDEGVTILIGSDDAALLALDQVFGATGA
jgi:hypothetical protein